MKLSFWTIGKAHDAYIKEGVADFTKRVSKYFAVEWNIIPVPKTAGLLSESDQKKREAETIKQYLKQDDFLIVLDEKGKQFTSKELAHFLQQRALDRTKKIVFLIGGAFGVDDEILKLSKVQWSLSSLTFPHQLVRLILAEQVYRACTILHNEKYHHQ